jgi:hemerythrin
MGQMQWNESLSVGIALIDDQHKIWIDKFNGISEAIESNQGPQRIAEALGFLSAYTRFHFDAEERYMAEYAYPDADAHKSKHEELKKTLADLEEEYLEDGATHILADSVDKFVGNWLAKHIKEVDVTFGAFLNQKGATITA